MILRFAARNSLSLKIVATVLGLLVMSSSGAQDKPLVQTETLLKSSESWDGTPYKSYPPGPPELTVLKITIPPHTALPWHTHPMPNAAYVVAGELVVETASGEKKVLKPGQTLPEMVGTVHRGISGDATVTLIVFYAGTKGMNLANVQHQ